MSGTAAPGDGDHINLSDSTFHGPVLGKGTQHIHLPTPAPTAVASLPAPPAVLVGREHETATLLHTLDPHHGDADAVAVCAVAGLAGVGKSALVLHAAHQAVAHGWFPGGHLFVNLRGYDPAGAVTPEAALGAVLRALCGADTALPTDAAEQAGLYRSQLADRDRRETPLLLVLDNASSAAQVEPLLPGTTVHRVLVTSRHTLASLPARLVDLAALEPQAATAMVTRLLAQANPGDSRAETEPDALVLVAKRCGYLPLALQISAAVLRTDQFLSLSALADELKTEAALLALAHSDGGQTLAVRAAFDLSYRRLPADQARLFRLLGLNPTAEISLEAAAALAGTVTGACRPLMVKLAQAHLVEPVSLQRWRLHDLVRAYAAQLAADETADEQKAAFGRLLEYYGTTAIAADKHLRALPGQPAPDRFPDQTTALAWLDAERLNLTAAVTQAATTARYREAVALSSHMPEYLLRRRFLDDAVVVAQTAVEAARNVSARQKAYALTTLGHVLREARRFDEAIDRLPEAVTIFKALGDRSSEAEALTNLGNALSEGGRNDEAINRETEAASIFKELGDRHRDEAGVMSNLGIALQQVGRVDEAIDRHTEAVTIFKALGDRRGEALALNNLGNALAQAGRNDEAIDRLTEAASISKQLDDTHRQGVALYTLGAALRQAGRFDEAINRETEAASIFKELSDRHNEAIALNNLGMALHMVGRDNEAISHHSEAARTFTELGDDRPNEASALANLGLALQEVGRFDEAIDRLSQAASIFQALGDCPSRAMVLKVCDAAEQARQQASETHHWWHSWRRSSGTRHSRTTTNIRT
ncbi:ATP-binding protein [Streptomyces sp. NPDC088560]|uniref:ATP-binding protein n=1 Tax=Streptomyces sp. NPDC088560 TaxID=3365868 RepID=UPI003823431E